MAQHEINVDLYGEDHPQHAMFVETTHNCYIYGDHSQQLNGGPWIEEWTKTDIGYSTLKTV